MDNYFCYQKGLEGVSSEELQLNQLFSLNLNSAEEVFQSQLSAMHKASITIPGQRTGTDPVCASSPWTYGLTA